MAGQTPIWKKEFRLRSKPPKAAAEAPVDTHKQQSASIWKKDLTLRSGKSKEKQPVETAATSEIEAAPSHGSMWKRELRIRRSVPKSRPSSELDSTLASAVEVEPMPLDLGSRESDDTRAPAQRRTTRCRRRLSRRRSCSSSALTPQKRCLTAGRRVRWRQASSTTSPWRRRRSNWKRKCRFRRKLSAPRTSRAIANLLPKNLRSTRTSRTGRPPR